MRAMKFSAVALLGALVVGISGCSSSDADEIAGGRVTTIDHKFGATTITGTPTRIVAADTQWLDALLELGIHAGGVPGCRPDGRRAWSVPVGEWRGRVGEGARSLGDPAVRCPAQS